MRISLRGVFSLLRTGRGDVDGFRRSTSRGPDGHSRRRSRAAQHVVRDTVRGDTNARSLVGCGQSLSGQRVVIVDPEVHRACPDGRIGEIWVRGTSVAAGYFDNPEATAEVFGARLADTEDGSFLRTGDLGFLRDGQLFVTGRLKDLIIIRGRNYYPEDIELAVEVAHPSFRAGHCAAFSTEIGEEERLVVVQEVEPRVRVLDSEAAFQAVRQAIATTFEVEVYSIVLAKAGVVPKTTSGKRRRAACRDLFLRDELDVHARWTAEVRNGHSHPLVSEYHGSSSHANGEGDRGLAGPANRCAIVFGNVASPSEQTVSGNGHGFAGRDGNHRRLAGMAQPPSLSHGDLQLPQHLVFGELAGQSCPGSRSPPDAKPAVTLPESDFDPERLLRDVRRLSEEDMVAFISQELAQQSQPH